MRSFTVAAMMLGVLFCAVGVAALRDASEAWAGVLLALTLLLLGASAAGIAYRRGGRRASWTGFAAFGWGYLTLTQGPWFAEAVEPRLPTTHWLAELHARINPGQVKAQPWTRMMESRPGPAPTLPDSYRNLRSGLLGVESSTASGPVTHFYLAARNNLDQFIRVGHCLLAVPAGLLGAGIFRWFHRTSGANPPA